MITKQDVHNTASLLNISISEQEAETLQASLATLVEYFQVMEKALETDQAPTTTTHAPIEESIAQYRDDQAYPYPHPESLIEKSEEHEENFVIVPNIL